MDGLMWKSLEVLWGWSAGFWCVRVCSLCLLPMAFDCLCDIAKALNSVSEQLVVVVPAAAAAKQELGLVAVQYMKSSAMAAHACYAPAVNSITLPGEQLSAARATVTAFLLDAERLRQETEFLASLHTLRALIATAAQGENGAWLPYAALCEPVKTALSHRAKLVPLRAHATGDRVLNGREIFMTLTEVAWRLLVVAHMVQEAGSPLRVTSLLQTGAVLYAMTTKGVATVTEGRDDATGLAWGPCTACDDRALAFSLPPIARNIGITDCVRCTKCLETAIRARATERWGALGDNAAIARLTAILGNSAPQQTPQEGGNYLAALSNLLRNLLTDS